jgi:hypothetical protein
VLLETDPRFTGLELIVTHGCQATEKLIFARRSPKFGELRCTPPFCFVVQYGAHPLQRTETYDQLVTES